MGTRIWFCDLREGVSYEKGGFAELGIALPCKPCIIPVPLSHPMEKAHGTMKRLKHQLFMLLMRYFWVENLSINDFSDVTLFKCNFLCSTKSFDIGLSVGYVLELVVYGDVLKSVLVLTLSHPLIELFKHTILIPDISIDVTKNTTSSVSEFETYFKILG